MTSKTYCPLPYMHQYITSSGYPTPCCHVFEDSSSSWSQADFKKGITTGRYNVMRKQMRQGHWPSICSKCKFQEERGDQSHRQIAVERFGEIEEVKIKYLDIAYSNKCNLACRMCKPSDSDKLQELYKDEKERPSWIEGNWPDIKETDSEEKVEWTKHLIKDGLEVLKVTGGEPTACKYFMGLVEWILDNDYASKIELQLTTNGTKLNKTLIEKLLKFKKVKLLLSIDGTGKVYDYIRHYASWEKTYGNLKLLTKNPNIQLQVALVASFYNVTNIFDLIEQCRKIGVSVYTDQDLKPENSEISPRNTDSNIRSILNKQADKIEKKYTTNSLVDFHARNSAKALRNIATGSTVAPNIKSRLIKTLQIQDRLYKTDYRDFLQIEQIEYLEGIHNE